MGIFNEQIRAEVESEGNRRTLVEEYGQFWFVVGKIVGALLGVVGAVADAVVLSALLYLSTKHLVGSAVVGVVTAVVIQLVLGSSVFRVVKNYRRGDYTKAGFRTMLYGLGSLALFLLAASLILSTKTGAVVEAVGEWMLERNKVDVSVVGDAYNARIDSLLSAEKQAVGELQQLATALQQDKIMDKGKLVTRWHASDRAGKIIEKEIPATHARFAAQIEAVRAEREEARQDAKTGNADMESKWEERIEVGKTWTVGVNVLFNLMRCLIIGLFAAFVVAAAEEQQQQSTTAKHPVATTVGATFTTPATPVGSVAQQQEERRRAGFDIPTPKAPDVSAEVEALRAELEAMKHAPATPVATPQHNNPQQAPTPVATTVERVVQHDRGGSYNVTVVDGEPTLPPPEKMNTSKDAFTLADVKRYIPTYAKRGSDNAKEIHRELLKMKAILEQEKK